MYMCPYTILKVKLKTQGSSVIVVRYSANWEQPAIERHGRFLRAFLSAAVAAADDRKRYSVTQGHPAAFDGFCGWAGVGRHRGSKPSPRYLTPFW